MGTKFKFGLKKFIKRKRRINDAPLLVTIQLLM